MKALRSFLALSACLSLAPSLLAGDSILLNFSSAPGNDMTPADAASMSVEVYNVRTGTVNTNGTTATLNQLNVSGTVRYADYYQQYQLDQLGQPYATFIGAAPIGNTGHYVEMEINLGDWMAANHLESYEVTLYYAGRSQVSAQQMGGPTPRVFIGGDHDEITINQVDTFWKGVGQTHTLSTPTLSILMNALDGSGEGTHAGIAAVRISAPLPLPAPTGMWLFDDPANLGKASIGTDLVIKGNAPAYSASKADAQLNPVTLNGVITTNQGKDHYLLATHASGPNGGGSYTNQYTLVYDVLVPGTGQWRSFFQTNTNNSNDGDYFVNNSGNQLGTQALKYSGGSLDPNRWYRLVISVNLANGGFHNTYVDGTPFFSHVKTDLDGRYALDPNQVLLFADDDGENAPLVVGLVGFYDRALNAAEIAKLGGVGVSLVQDLNNTAPQIDSIIPAVTTAETGEAVAATITATDPEGNQVQVQMDWGDGSFSGWSSFAGSGTPLTLSHEWSLPGTMQVRARARDDHGYTSAWSDTVTIQITGVPYVGFITRPYRQNASPTGMVIMAEVDVDTPLHLRYGKQALDHSVACESVSSGGGTYYIRGIISGLEPDTTYQYRFAAAGGEVLRSDDGGTFVTSPAPGVWKDLVFSQIGDTQGTNHSTWDADPWEPAKSMLHDMLDRGVMFGLGTGDHAEDGGSYSWTRDSYLHRLASILGAKVPYYISWGNHDSTSPTATLRLAADLPSRYRTDSYSAHTPGSGNYSFEYSGVFVLALDHYNIFTGTNSYNNNPTQNDILNGWVESQLSSPAARDARFRIVMVHVPPYCENWIDGNSGLRRDLVPLMEQYKVDVCISGHMHGYQRGKLNGVNYIISGGGSWLDFPEPLTTDWPHMFVGGYSIIDALYARQSSFGVLGPAQPLVNNMFNQYTLFTVRDRYLKMECLGFHADGSPMGVVDSFEIGTDPGPDSDGDGLRDAWEIAHGLDPHDPTGDNGADGDPDGDGQTNLQEQQAGTHPHDASSVFRVLGGEMTDMGWAISWSSVEGKSYHFELSDDMQTWQPILQNGTPLRVPAAVGDVTSVVLPPPNGQELQKFVRVVVAR